MLRKFLLTGLILFLAPGSIAQLASALLIGAYFMAAHVKYQPFISDDEDNLQSVSLISTVLILVLGIMLKARRVCPNMAIYRHMGLGDQEQGPPLN
jgi:hypothetical protein